MTKTLIKRDSVVQPSQEKKTKRVPNFWVEVVSLLALLTIAAIVGYLILNFSSIVEFRELN